MTDSVPDNTTRIRPYLITGGRTRSVIDLPLETQLLISEAGLGKLETLGPEQRQIAELCRTRQSVAEVSAHAGMYLGVTRVLIGDLVQDEILSLQNQTEKSTARPDVRLLQRVLNGLQSL